MTDPELGEYTYDHKMKYESDGSLLIQDICPQGPDKCFVMVATGHHYHDYGITDGSRLFCVKTKSAKPGDLVLIMESVGKTAVYLYMPTRALPEGSGIRVLTDRTKIYAKIIGAFNFYS